MKPEPSIFLKTSYKVEIEEKQIFSHFSHYRKMNIYVLRSLFSEQVTINNNTRMHA